jgi:hypothetical protein
MAFFSLTDIKIDNKEKRFKSAKSIIPSKYMSDVSRYPQDIGSLNKGHYMVIHVNQQVKTSFEGNTNVGGDLPTIFENKNKFGTRQGLEQSSQAIGQLLFSTSQTQGVDAAVNQANALLDKIGGAATEYANISQELVQKILKGLRSASQESADVAKEYLKQLATGNGLRTIERTTDTIALYMPDTLNFTNNQQYSTMEFGSSPLALLGAAAAGYSYLDKQQQSAIPGELAKNLTPFILSQGLRRFGGNAGLALFAAASGTTINPQLELIYSSPSFREFRFDFMMYPRSSKEAREVQKILNKLRFHQAPEILREGSAGGLGGFFLVPPSEFDIKFYYNGRINPNIPSISTCVLTSIDTDYAPNGWAAYEVPEDVGEATIGGTGMPVGIRLTLTFQETEIMTKDNFFESGDVSVMNMSGDFLGNLA